MRYRSTLLTILLLLFSSPANAWRVLQRYDVASSYQLSAAVVLAEIGDSEHFKTKDGECNVHTITILKSLKGDIKEKSTCQIAGLDAFYHDDLKPLNKGEKVYLFLVANDGKTGYSMYHLTPATWAVIESGARLVDGGKVYSFGQPPHDMNNHDFLMVSQQIVLTNKVTPNAYAPTTAEFEQRLTDSAVAIQETEDLTKQDATNDQMKSFIETRRLIMNEECAYDDTITGAVIEKLFDKLTPMEVEDLKIGTTFQASMMKEEYFKRSQGREYAMDQISDPAQPANRREKFASMLRDAGFNYCQEAATALQHQDQQFKYDFATRLARLGVEQQKEKYFEALISGVADCGTSANRANPALSDDLESSCKVLRDAFPGMTPMNQFQTAGALMRLDPKGYRKLFPNAGRLLTVLYPNTQTERDLSGRVLNLSYDYRCGGAAPALVKLVLQPVTGGKEIELNVKMDYENMANQFGSRMYNYSEKLPNKIHGKYRMFLRGYDHINDQSCDGIANVIEIPEASSSSGKQ